LLEHLPARPTLPSISYMKGSSDGRLWIREHPNPMRDRVAWIALNGTWEREEIVEIPVTLRVLDFSASSVLVLAKGEFWGDLIEVYLIER
jgi:hypothetical protein